MLEKMPLIENAIYRRKEKFSSHREHHWEEFFITAYSTSRFGEMHLKYFTKWSFSDHSRFISFHRERYEYHMVFLTQKRSLFTPYNARTIDCTMMFTIRLAERILFMERINPIGRRFVAFTFDIDVSSAKPSNINMFVNIGSPLCGGSAVKNETRW